MPDGIPLPADFFDGGRTTPPPSNDWRDAWSAADAPPRVTPPDEVAVQRHPVPFTSAGFVLTLPGNARLPAQVLHESDSPHYYMLSYVTGLPAPPVTRRFHIVAHERRACPAPGMTLVPFAAVVTPQQTEALIFEEIPHANQDS